MAQIIRCDICQAEANPEKTYHAMIRYWDNKLKDGMLREIQFDVCPTCYPSFLMAVETVQDRTRSLVVERQKEW